MKKTDYNRFRRSYRLRKLVCTRTHRMYKRTCARIRTCKRTHMPIPANVNPSMPVHGRGKNPASSKRIITRKKDWLEDVAECLKDERITIKQSFQIYTNFSLVDHKAQMKLKKQCSVSIAEIDNTPLKIDVSNVIIEKIYT